MANKFLVKKNEAKIMGVAAGLADYTGVDALLIRLGLVGLTLATGGIVILFYILTGLLADAA